MRYANKNWDVLTTQLEREAGGRPKIIRSQSLTNRRVPIRAIQFCIPSRDPEKNKIRKYVLEN